MLSSVGKVVCLPNDGGKGCRKRRQPDSPRPAKKAGQPDESRIPSWQYLLTGLWYSGLRLGEALELHWNDKTKIQN